jgi:hypothetical protein
MPVCPRRGPSAAPSEKFNGRTCRAQSFRRRSTPWIHTPRTPFRKAYLGGNGVCASTTCPSYVPCILPMRSMPCQYLTSIFLRSVTSFLSGKRVSQKKSKKKRVGPSRSQPGRRSDAEFALGRRRLSVGRRIRLTRPVGSAMIGHPCEYQNAEGEVPDDDVTHEKGKKGMAGGRFPRPSVCRLIPGSATL